MKHQKQKKAPNFGAFFYFMNQKDYSPSLDVASSIPSSIML